MSMSKEESERRLVTLDQLQSGAKINTDARMTRGGEITVNKTLQAIYEEVIAESKRGGPGVVGEFKLINGEQVLGLKLDHYSGGHNLADWIVRTIFLISKKVQVIMFDFFSISVQLYTHEKEGRVVDWVRHIDVPISEWEKIKLSDEYCGIHGRYCSGRPSKWSRTDELKHFRCP